MKKLLYTAKENLLGIAVAIGVISFTYEGVFSTYSDFSLTKSSAVLIFIVAIRFRYKDNLTRQKSLFKKSFTKESDFDTKKNGNI